MYEEGHSLNKHIYCRALVGNHAKSVSQLLDFRGFSYERLVRLDKSTFEEHAICDPLSFAFGK